jgi:AAA15 family ATPase/GTPase
MLIEFVFNNVLSYKDEAYFSMETGPRLFKNNDTHTMKMGNHRVLKSALAFGANASGKSNLLKALNLLRMLIVNPTQAVGESLLYSPFVLDDNSATAPSNFQITISAEKRVLRYSISYTSKKVISEKLEIEKGANFITYFNRDNENDIFDVPEYLTPHKKTVRDNTLLLFFAQSLNDELAAVVYKWFVQDLILVEDNFNTELFSLLNDAMNKELFLRFLQAADFQIEDIDIRMENNEIPAEIRNVMQQMGANLPVNIPRKQLYLMHSAYDNTGKQISAYPISFDAESQGTKKIVLIALIILSRRKESKVIVIDEFDDSFHLKLSQALLDVFNSKDNINQFILTTHELQLMDNNLRKDQIYFVEKEYTGNSKLFSLFDFTEEAFKRSDISYMKRYMSGQFGGSPIISLDGLLDAVHRSATEVANGK